MKLVIGGYAQGKLNYVLHERKSSDYFLFDGILPTDEQLQTVLSGEKTVIINHFHTWVRECLLRGEDPDEQTAAFLKQVPDCIMISDEIGNGIVPMEAFEREYRETTGRLLIQLAAQADEVVRVICGIGQKLK